MVESRSGAGASLIILAAEPEFDIGKLHVRPRRLEVCWGGEQRRELEPRVMQVLVALAHANDEVVSRDELAELCWGGRIVGDHALNRCIHALRQLAASIDPPAFEIRTTPRVGYRLARCQSGQGSGADTAGGQPPHSRAPLDLPAAAHGTPALRLRRPDARIAIAAVLVLLLVTAVALRWLWPDNSTPTVAVVDRSGGPASALARDLGTQLARFAGARASEMALVGNPAEADFIVRTSVRRGDVAGHGEVALLDRNTGKLLWSSSVEVPLQQIGKIVPQMSAKLGNVLMCAVQTSGAGAGLDHGTTKLYLAACELMEDHPTDHLIGLLRKVTSRAPSFGEGWANLAAAEASVHALSLMDTQTLGDHDLASAARAHLIRAREIDPKLGATYVAEAELLPPYRFARRIEVLETGIANSPDHAQLYEHLSSALFRVGRTTEAIISAERASALNPLSPASRSALIGSLAHAGNLPRARRELIAAERIWPDSPAVMNAAFGLEYRYGDARKAEELMARGRALIGGRSGGFGGPQIVMRARLDPSPENVARLKRFAVTGARRVPQAAPARLQSLGMFGGTEESYQVIEQPGVIQHLALSTDVIFRPHLRQFRNDKRFPAVAARLGLLQYWQSSNSWPDFCNDPQLPYDCRAEARRILDASEAA